MSDRFLLIVIVLLFVSGCGKKGPLLYPDMLVPAAVSTLTAARAAEASKSLLNCRQGSGWTHP